MIVKQLRALWTLGVAFFKYLILYPFTRHRGPRAWLARLRLEALGPTPQDAWSYVAETSRCIGCGLCDLAAQDVGFVASEWLLSAPRRAQDAGVVLGEALALRGAAQEVAAVCPTGVRVDVIARLIVDHRDALHDGPSLETRGSS